MPTSTRLRNAALVAACVAAIGIGAPARSATLPVFHTLALPGSNGGNEPSIAVSSTGVRFASWQAPGHAAVSGDGIAFSDRGVIDKTTLGDVTNAIDADAALYNGQVCGTDGFAGHTCVYRSTDGGRTWPQKTPVADSHPGASDRPWIDVYPHRPGTPAAGSPTTVYLEYHTFTPEELAYVTVSHDAGKTFSTPKIISSDTNAIVASGCNTNPGGIAVDDRDGTAYAVWVSGQDVVANAEGGCNYAELPPFNKVWVSTSTDGGNTWTSHLAWQGAYDPVNLSGDNAAKTFTSISVDKDGQVQLFFAVRRNDATTHLFTSCTTTGCNETPTTTDLVLVTSPDKGAHWTKPFSFNPSGGSNYFPWSAAGSGGIVDGVYYTSPTLKPDDATNVWHVGFSQITGATARLESGAATYVTTPNVVSTLFEPNPVHRGGICTFGLFCSAMRGSNRNLADSIAIAIDPAGGANAVWTNDFADPTKRTIEFGCQTAGASAFAGAPDLTGCDAAGSRATKVFAKRPVRPRPVPKPTRPVLPATGAGDSSTLALAMLGAAVAIRARTRSF